MILTNEIIFETFDEAMNVHTRLFEIMRNNGIVTCADLYKVSNEKYETSDPEYYKYGWTNLWGSKVEPFGYNGYWVLRLPEIINLEKENEK